MITIKLSLNDLKIAHDAVLTQEEIAGDDPEVLGDVEQYTDLRKRLKVAIDTVESKAVVEAQVEE